MFGAKETLLDRALMRAVRELSGHAVGSQEYEKTLNTVIKIHKMVQDEKPKPVSKDTLLIVSANLLGILLIINHEYANPIMSKAMGLILKPRA
ncbi:MAG TPA: hypothetical protein VH815_13760 [Acidobacteriota bacterium]